MRRIRSKATYANVMASIAVFVAIGGTSVAAVTLHRDSVGDREIRSRSIGASEMKRGAVTSRALRNGGVRLRDISRSTKAALKGRPGPAGPPGPSGTPAVTFKASFNAAGQVTAGSVVSQTPKGLHRKLVRFDRSVAGCVPFASLARNPGADPVHPGAGRIVVGIEADRVMVETFDAGGNPAALGFNVIVAC